MPQWRRKGPRKSHFGGSPELTRQRRPVARGGRPGNSRTTGRGHPTIGLFLVLFGSDEPYDRREARRILKGMAPPIRNAGASNEPASEQQLPQAGGRVWDNPFVAALLVKDRRGLAILSSTRMRRHLTITCLLLLSAAGCAAISQSRVAAQPSDMAQLRTIRDVALPGDTSRFDYESFDPEAHRLYIAHLGAGSVVVYDTQQSQMIAEIPGVPGVHGVLAIPELGRVYATATSSRQIAAIDGVSLSVVAMAQGDGYPDGLA